MTWHRGLEVAVSKLCSIERAHGLHYSAESQICSGNLTVVRGSEVAKEVEKMLRHFGKIESIHRRSWILKVEGKDCESRELFFREVVI